MALTQQTILEKLHDIQAPGGRMSLVEAGAVRGIEVEDDGSVTVVLAVEATDPTVASEVRTVVEASLAQIEGVESVEVTVHPLLATVQPGPTHAPEPPPTWADKIPGVKQVIAVASGKGGVGKSTVSANLAFSPSCFSASLAGLALSSSEMVRPPIVAMNAACCDAMSSCICVMTGSASVVWPSAVGWASGGAPKMSTESSAEISAMRASMMALLLVHA